MTAAVDDSNLPSIIAVDVDGVLINGLDDDGYLWQQAMLREFGIHKETLDPFFRRDWNACILGDADVLDVLPAYLDDWGFKGTAEDFVAFWFAHDAHLDHDLVADLDQIKSQCQLVMATNQDRHRARYLWDDLRLSETFEHMFASSALGAQKPDPAFWHAITTTLEAANPSDILLIDDNGKNVDSARRFGWQAIHYRDRSDLDGLLGPA